MKDAMKTVTRTSCYALALTLLAGLSACGGSGGANEIIIGSGRVVFFSTRSGNDDIWIMNDDGTSQEQLTIDADIDNFPFLSRDHQWILFRSDRDFGPPEIYKMRANGTEKTRITNDSHPDYGPAFSFDMTKIVYTSDRTTERVVVMNADGTGEVVLTDDQSDNHSARFSPQGTQIAFFSNRDGNGEIYKMDADGNNQVNLTNSALDEFHPTWSPDGTKIAYKSTGGAGVDGIYVMNADGTGKTKISPDFHAAPVWTHDGLYILTVHHNGTSFDVYRMDPDGGNVTQLTTNTALDWTR